MLEKIKRQAGLVALLGIAYAFCKICVYQPFVEWHGRIKASEEGYSFLLRNDADRDKDGKISLEEKSILFQILDNCRKNPSEPKWETLSSPYSSWDEIQRINCAGGKYGERF